MHRVYNSQRKPTMHTRFACADFVGDGLPHNFFKQPELSLERRIFNSGIKPRWGLQYSFTMAESFKRIFTMIFADATIASSAKGQVMIGEMPARIIDACPAGRNCLQPFFFLFAV